MRPEDMERAAPGTENAFDALVDDRRIRRPRFADSREDRVRQAVGAGRRRIRGGRAHQPARAAVAHARLRRRSRMSTPALSPPARAARSRRRWLVAPALIFIVALFIYPFAYGLVLSFRPMNGGGAVGQLHRRSSPTRRCGRRSSSRSSSPCPRRSSTSACRCRWRSRCAAIRRYQKFVTTLLVIPVTLGTVLIADGMLTYFGPNGWFPQALQGLHLYTRRSAPHAQLTGAC